MVVDVQPPSHHPFRPFTRSNRMDGWIVVDGADSAVTRHWAPRAREGKSSSKQGDKTSWSDCR